ncbi:hypothetical protein E4U21_001331 [Claviceps maximensis]|nr:hypothetical protein E4U21_001331 [Claviceps maximensis]
MTSVSAIPPNLKSEFDRRPLHGQLPLDIVSYSAQIAPSSHNGKYLEEESRPTTDDRTRRPRKLILANLSALFRKNYAMLAAVFGAGFAFEVGFNNGINKWWDNHNRGRQWKDIRNRYVEGGDEDEE